MGNEAMKRIEIGTWVSDMNEIEMGASFIVMIKGEMMAFR